MPNWSEGVLKIRGTKQNIENFFRNGIDYNDYRYEISANKDTGKSGIQTIVVPRDCSIEIDDDEIIIKNTKGLYIKNTYRMFIMDNEIWRSFHKKDADAKEVVYFSIQQAWAVSAQDLQTLSKQYNCDFKIFATECGMEFCQDIEVVEGEIIRNEEINYDDFRWEAPNPTLGG